MTHNIGTKPGVGTYCCSTSGCDWQVELDDASDVLPPCGNCGAGQTTTYIEC